jgi:hypothetical protein
LPISAGSLKTVSPYHLNLMPLTLFALTFLYTKKCLYMSCILFQPILLLQPL